MEKAPSEFEQRVIDFFLKGTSPYSMTRLPEFKGQYPSTLDRILIKYRIKKRVPSRQPNYFEQELIDIYKKGYSVSQIIKLEQFEGLTQSKIYSILKRFNITCRSNKINSRIYKLNHHFFANIDDEEKAYWLGFIYADGYVTTKGNYFGISLAKQDRPHLEKLVGTLRTNYPIREYIVSNGYREDTIYCRLIVCSETIKKDLISKGVLTKKSLRLIFPSLKIVPLELLNHFIRGYFDGDGSLSNYKRNCLRFFSIKICGTYEFLDSLKSHLEVALELNRLGSICKGKKDNKNNYYLSIGGNIQVAKVLKYFYKDATLYLDRKYLRYSNFFATTNL